MSFFAMTSAPCCSPSYTISTLPVIAGNVAGRSQRRGETLFSRFTNPLRSRFDARISIAEIGMRAETPED